MHATLKYQTITCPRCISSDASDGNATAKCELAVSSYSACYCTLVHSPVSRFRVRTASRENNRKSTMAYERWITPKGKRPLERGRVATRRLLCFKSSLSKSEHRDSCIVLRLVAQNMNMTLIISTIRTEKREKPYQDLLSENLSFFRFFPDKRAGKRFLEAGLNNSNSVA